MPFNRTRRGGRVAVAAAMAVVFASVMGFATAGADEAPPSTPPSSTTTLAVEPTTTTPDVPTTPVPEASTTTTSSLPVSTTTLRGEGPLDASDGPVNAASIPAPAIPSASSDPLFHAARTVDADFRAIELARPVYDTAKVAYAAARKALKPTAATLAAKRAESTAADARATKARIRLRAAALHAYTGYGAQGAVTQGQDVSDSATVLPYRTYVSVTISELSNDLKGRLADSDQARVAVDAASQKHQGTKAASVATYQRVMDAKKTFDDAQIKLMTDRKALNDLVGTISDLAPGSLQLVVDPADLPPGVQLVDSPAGQIIVPAKADPRTAIVLQFIVAQLGKPYVWGATGPNSYDCSGLLLRAFQSVGVTSIPRVSQSQQVWATPVPALEAQPGDLVFFGQPAYHVGIYIGGGLMLDAPYTGTVVRIDKVWKSVTGFGRPVW